MVQVDPEEVAVGDVITVKAGERVPLDGVVLEGTSMVNTSALTGESVPREVCPGDNVISGCINQTGLLRDVYKRQVLQRVGAIRQEGKRGSAYLYTRAGTPCETAAIGG